jgi:hypothetical protein
VSRVAGEHLFYPGAKHAGILDVELRQSDLEADGLFVGDPVVIKQAQARRWQQRLVATTEQSVIQPQKQLLLGPDGHLLRPSDPICLIHAHAPAITSSELTREDDDVELRAKQSATIALRRLSTAVHAAGTGGLIEQLDPLVGGGAESVAVRHIAAAREYDLMSVVVDPTINSGAAELAIRLESLYFKSHPLFNDEQVWLPCHLRPVQKSSILDD